MLYHLWRRVRFVALNAFFVLASFTLPGWAGHHTADQSAKISGIPAGVYKVDATHAYIGLQYDHRGLSSPIIFFRKFEADLNLQTDDPAASTVQVAIDAASIDTGTDIFDDHMVGKKFFDAINHPQIRFASTGITVTGKKTGQMVGDLTIKGVRKPVMLDVTFNRALADGRSNSYLAGFSARGTLRRSDWGMDVAVPYVGDDVTLLIEVEFQLPKQSDSDAAVVDTKPMLHKDK